MAAADEGNLIVSGSEDKSIKIFDIEEEEEIHCFGEAHEGKKICMPGRLLKMFRYDKFCSDIK